MADRKRIEEERAQEVLKEAEMVAYEKSEGTGKDPRTSALKFMYSQPLKKESSSSTSSSSSGKDDKVVGKHFECTVGADGDDEMVRRFREKLTKKKNDEHQDGSVSDEEHFYSVAPENREAKKNLIKKKLDPNFGASAHQSALEKETGKRRRLGLTMDEQAERFSFLKNAPLEGVFAKGIEVRHKPFNEIVRNVQCIRCGEWGHQSGDRECALRDYNPHDFARQKREDPLTFMQSSAFLVCRTSDHEKLFFHHVPQQVEKQKMILRHAAVADPMGAKKGEHVNDEGVEEDEESDPEAEFIATLTPREKKLLLRRLQVLEGEGVEGAPTGTEAAASSDDSDSSDGSDSSSSSGSDESSDEDEKEKSKSRKSSKKKKTKRKSKKEKKHKSSNKSTKKSSK